MRTVLWTASLTAIIAAAGCRQDAAPPADQSADNTTQADHPSEVIEASAPQSPEPAAPADETPDDNIRDQLLASAVLFEHWPQANTAARFAPYLCTPVGFDPVAVMSKSDHAVTHGDKLYHLYVRYLDPGYPDPGLQMWGRREGATPAEGWEAPIGQTLVKQSWTSSNATDDGAIEPGRSALHNGERYVMDEPFALFMMHKSAPDTPGTDQGWTYAVLSPDGKEVQRMGALEDCMSCHVKAKFDRLFGQEVAWKAE